MPKSPQIGIYARVGRDGQIAIKIMPISDSAHFLATARRLATAAKCKEWQATTHDTLDDALSSLKEDYGAEWFEAALEQVAKLNATNGGKVTAIVHLWDAGEFTRQFSTRSEAYRWARKTASPRDLVEIAGDVYRKVSGSLIRTTLPVAEAH